MHHGIWDNDIPDAPILADIVVNGRTIKAVAQPTKQAFLYVFDRVTGQPIWPIEERPVPKGDVPKEWYSPTQPFPLDAHGKPFNYDTQGFTVDDLIDFTPELRAGGAEGCVDVQAGADLHSAGGEQGGRAAGDALHGRRERRHELAGRLLRSRDAHPVRELAKIAQPARARAASP